ncbi:MAG: DUF669 domain-containing protein [Deltaproteobacteria bacterium]|nr:DUF669 domain-containing protein [Deltaproteobacteria bacterium]
MTHPHYDTSFNSSEFESNSVDLTQFDSDYEEAEVPGSDFESVPDGNYQVNVESAELTTAKTSGAPMLKWKLRIIGPAHANRILFRNSVIDGKKIQWIKKDLYTCGLTLPKISELQQNLSKLLDIKLEITKKTNTESGYENIYFNRRIITTDTPGYATSTGTDSKQLDQFDNSSTDDVPF